MHNSPPRGSNGSAFPQFTQMTVFNPDTMLEMQKPMLTAMADFNSRWIEGITAFNKEWVKFVNTRLNEDMAATKQLAECKTVQDVFGVYSDFFQTAAKHYQGEFEQISKIGKSLADDTMHQVQDGLKEISSRSRAA